MGPILLIDKSTFQSLSLDEHMELNLRFLPTLVPVLYYELIADLTKEKCRVSPEDEVYVLAKKFLGSAGPPNAHFRALCSGSLFGRDVPMTGQVLVDRGEVHRVGGGESAWFIDMQPENEDIVRWAHGEFVERDWETARKWRKAAQATSKETFISSLERYRVVVPKARRVEELPEVLEKLRGDSSIARPLIDWLMEMIDMPTPGGALVRARWRSSGGSLRAFAPYAYHCVSALLSLFIAVNCGARQKWTTSAR